MKRERSLVTSRPRVDSFATAGSMRFSDLLGFSECDSMCTATDPELFQRNRKRPDRIDRLRQAASTAILGFAP